MVKELNFQHAFALLIGVGSPGIEKSADDAYDIGYVLQDQALGSYPPEQVIILTNGNANKSRVMEVLTEIVRKSQSEGDSTIIIYYSGHGYSQKTDNSDTSEYYLATHNYDRNRPEETMISASEFSTMVNSVSSDRLLVILDCCHAEGIITDDGKALPNNKTQSIGEGVTGVDFMPGLNSGRGRIFISSCAKNEKSVILPSAKNSLFTEVLLEALKGAASGNEPYVKAIDLLYLLLKEVPKRIKPYSHAQNPVVNEVKHLNSDFILCHNAADPKQSERIDASEEQNVSTNVNNDKEKIDFIKRQSQHIYNKSSIVNQSNIKNNSSPINLS